MVSKDGTQQLIYYIEKGQYVECYGHVILFFECHEKHFDCCETLGFYWLLLNSSVWHFKNRQEENKLIGYLIM